MARSDAFDTLLQYGIDLRRRRVYLHSAMEMGDKPGEGVIEHVVRGLHQLDQTPDRSIELWINTPGGEVSEMFGLYDIIRGCESEIITIGFGEVCSAGGLILACGDRRMATENCLFMAHNCNGGVDSDNSLPTIEAQVEATRRAWNRWAVLMARHTTHAAKWWREFPDRKRELWLSAQEMAQKQHGIIDSVWGLGVG